MNIVKEYPGMHNLLLRAAQWLGFPEFQRNLLSNLRFCDRLLHEMHHDPLVPEAVRIEVYSTLLSPGPGGILAFSWLVSQQKTHLLKSYLDCLPGGPPRADALDDKAAIESARIILFHPSLSEEEFVRASTQLLTCNALTISARQATFRYLIQELAGRPSVCRQLAHWATGQVEGAPLNVPPAGEELLRTACTARLKLQEPFEELLELVLSSPHRQAAAESGLDLIETHLTRIQPERRKNLLEQARNHSEARVRRRAYQLAESSEGEHFLRLGLRDLDAGVRAWVITRVTQLQRSGRAG